MTKLATADDEPSKAAAAPTASQSFAQISGLAQIAHAVGELVTEDHEVVLEAFLRPAGDPLLDRIDQHGGKRGSEDDRPFAIAVPVIVIDQLLERIGSGGEH